MNKVNEYINSPTKLLVESIEDYVQQDAELANSSRVSEAFRQFSNVSKRVPSFIHFVDKIFHQGTYSTQPSIQTITLIQIYLVMRVLSTYSAIPFLVGQLQLNGEYEAAAKINSNAIDEGGGKGRASHHELLMRSLNIVIKHLGGLDIDTKLIVCAIRIRELFETNSIVSPSNLDRLWDLLMTDSQYVGIKRDELSSALNLSKYINNEMLRYHRHIHRTLLAPAIADPYNKTLLAYATLELAKREAESVDERSKNRSFIGAWERLVTLYRGQISEGQFEEAMRWSLAHNSENEARLAGWTDISAEDGHARDAREVALRFLKTLDVSDFAKVLEQVTENAHLRLKHWDSLIASIDHK